MNVCKYVSILVFLLFLFSIIKAQPGRIVIEIESDIDMGKRPVQLSYWPTWSVEPIESEVRINSCFDKENKLSYVLHTDSILSLYFDGLIKLNAIRDCVYFASPGDSVKIKLSKGSMTFSGRGASKFEMVCKSDSIAGSYAVAFKNTEFKDFFEKNSYISSAKERVLAVINGYERLVTPSFFKLIKADLLSRMELDRILGFFQMIAKKRADYGNDDFCTIYDSTITPVYIKEFSKEQANPSIQLKYYLFTLNLLDYYRKNRFSNYVAGHDKEESKKMIECYFHAKDFFKDRVREELMAEIMTFWIIRKVGFTAEVEKVLENYYVEAKDMGFRRYVKDYEIKSRKLIAGGNAYDFTVTNENGDDLRLSDFKGKVLLIDLWFSGCKGCVELTPELRKVETTFKGNPNVVFLSISVDAGKDRWLASVKKGKYTTGMGLNAYTSGKGTQHELIKKYNVMAYPAIFLIDENGQFIANPPPDPRKDGGVALVDMINRHLHLMMDGPYVLYNKDALVAKTLHVEKMSTLRVDSLYLSRDASPDIKVGTDIPGKYFNIRLKKALQREQSVYPAPSKILALSDIEGNFSRFRELLQAGGVIDTAFNWTFGDGHLVLLGDFFDRGRQVTECLWLIYALEEKAKAYGGYVHFILGNHEIMNLSGNTKYVHKKYLNNQSLLGMDFTDLYGEGTELGKWLRTKNIIERIGDILFVHGGISKEVNKMGLSIKEINDLVWPFYAKGDSIRHNSGKTDLDVLYSTKVSPFWYRDYYESPTDPDRATETQVDSSLNIFDAHTIVTGHTIVDDTISVHYDGKVVNIDTRHASGKSEALLIAEDRYYRLNVDGAREIMYKKEDNIAVNLGHP